ncbi:16S rRNA (uracil(1498)-N(3))-methyltransferase [Neosynechococcus sphagnicola]|uniref:16S rRNA (uracil(1498)-N(3))-methyltransferase n=1 Tax=Neosynechococcus sphagnicola TaxID=1501145 RepID=UPI00068EBD71|nr:16S rRNA (uracil(1498)-N(3))-methyltransferase [Neosynechococcus sphagnicola]
MPQLQRLAIAASQIQYPQITLTADQQHYLSRVLRLSVGDQFIAINGQGQAWIAEIAADAAQILEVVEMAPELPIVTTLLVALPKGTGFEDVIRQVTEMGVTCIQPLLSQRTLLKPSLHKLERWQRIAQEAAEQSERAVIPTILAPVAFSAALALATQISPTHHYLCVARGNAPHLLDCLRQSMNWMLTPPQTPLDGARGRSLIIATGPEGGWTDLEIKQAIAQKFQPVSLGKRVLRAVTAPLVAMSLVAAVCESRQQPAETPVNLRHP